MQLWEYFEMMIKDTMVGKSFLNTTLNCDHPKVKKNDLNNKLETLIFIMIWMFLREFKSGLFPGMNAMVFPAKLLDYSSMYVPRYSPC